MNTYNCSGLIKFKEKVQFMMEIKAGVMLSICLIFHQKIRLGMLINVILLKKRNKFYLTVVFTLFSE